MKLDKNIKPTPIVLSKLLYYRRIWGFFNSQTLYLRRNVYFDLISPTPSLKSKGILKHELTHWNRARKIGVSLWKRKYIVYRKFRLNEEILAYTSQMKYIKSRGYKFNTKQYAKALSSWVYLWAGKYEEIKKQLDINWNKI